MLLALCGFAAAYNDRGILKLDNTCEAPALSSCPR